MEESPLTRAHDHARAASAATQQSESTVAINEHALAAGEFANAAKTTTSVDALRTLKLLENHHRRLAELLKLPLERKVHTIDLEDEKQTGENPSPNQENGATKQEQQQHSNVDHDKPGQVPALNQAQSLHKRYPPRVMTSSIASNLASARGIRSRDRGQPVPPSVTNDQAPGNLETTARQEASPSKSKMQNVLDQSGRPGWVPPVNMPPRTDVQKNAADTTDEEGFTSASDDNYSRFYNTFGGLINKLSAPLAFAGLPLITEESSSLSQEAHEPAPTSPAARRTRHKSPASQAEPDLSKIYSHATIRAVSGHNPNESFYVVPTSGHTMSYASILNYADKEKRRLEASIHGGGAQSLAEEDEDDDFVDARESPHGPPSPTFRRRVGAGSSSVGAGGKGRGVGLTNSKTVEELAMENKSLKEVLDKLSRRLHAFEASAQNSHLALAESMRFRRPGSPLSTTGSGSGGGGHDEAAALRTKNKELEEQMALSAQRMEALEKEQQKLQRTLAKYREKWEKLKAGAKARREAQGGSVENAAAGDQEA